MKKLSSILLGLTLLLGGTLLAAEKKSGSLDRFYGTITKLDLEANHVTVFNKKRQLTSDFLINDETKVIFKKKSMPKDDLKIGQFLIVTYRPSDDDLNLAQKITVRVPYKRKKKSL